MWKYIQIVSFLLFSNSEALSSSDYSYVSLQQPQFDGLDKPKNYTEIQTYENGIEPSIDDENSIEECDDETIQTELPKRQLKARRRSNRPSRRTTRRTTRKRTTRKRTTRRRSYRRPVVRRKVVVRSSYYRRPTIRRKKIIVIRTRPRRKRVIVVRRGGYRAGYTTSYFRLSSYLAYKRRFNYNRCSSYGYYAYECVGYKNYSYSYWDNSMLSLCTRSGYVNSRCRGRTGYTYIRVKGYRYRGSRRVVVVRSSGGGLIGGLVGLCIFCCIIGLIVGMCSRKGNDVHIVDEEVIIVEEHHDDPHYSAHVEVEIHDDYSGSGYSSDHIVEGEVYIMGDTHGHHYDDYGHEEVIVIDDGHHDYGHEEVVVVDDHHY